MSIFIKYHVDGGNGHLTVRGIWTPGRPGTRSEEQSVIEQPLDGNDRG